MLSIRSRSNSQLLNRELESTPIRLSRAEKQFVQELDFEPTASTDFVPAGELDPNYDPVNYEKLVD